MTLTDLQPGHRPWRRVLGLLVVLGASLASAALAAQESAEVPADVRGVRIEGLSGEILDNVRLNLRLAAEDCSAPRWRVRRLYARVEAEIAEAMHPFGFYAPQVRKQLAFGADCWSALLRVEPGDRVHWSAVELRISGGAAGDPAFMQSVDQAKPLPGSPLLHTDYEALKAKVLLQAAERGYRDGRFTRQELRVDPARLSAAAVLHYDSGDRYRFGEITVEQSAFDSDLIDRYIRISPGDPYDAVAIARLQRTLLDTGLFRGVEVTPGFGGNAERRVPVAIRLTPRRRHAYTAGIGASTDEGARLRLGYENRRLNRRGHSGDVLLRLSQVRYGIDLAYKIPMRDPANEQLNFLAGYQHEDIDGNVSDSYKAGVRYTHQRWKGLFETWSLEASQEQFRLGQDIGSSRLILPGVIWDWGRGDDPIYPRDAWRFTLDLRGTAEVLTSDVDFLRAHLRAKRILSFGETRLIARGEIGSSLVSQFDELPASQRFFAGGDTSVRGYGYQTLGPRDATGQVVGGDRLLVASLELDRPVRERWSLAVFADTGNAFTGSDLALHHSVGVGVRWHSPVGPVRIDLAHPLDDDASAIRLHLSVGPDL
jgi:translocation and assembly module TamA